MATGGLAAKSTVVTIPKMMTTIAMTRPTI
jgi:hypothetical protein